MVEAMEWPEGYVESLHRYNKVLDEWDVMRLSTLRIVLKLANMIRMYKGRFVVTKDYATILDKRSAGRTYARLFQMHFSKYNLAHSDGMPEYPEVQGFIRYTFYVIGRRAEDWIPLPDIAQIAFSPAVAKGIEGGRYHDEKETLLDIRILPALERFGLVECERKAKRDWMSTDIQRVRITPLFHRFLEFPLGR
jgi:hypothetical protein